MAERAEYVVKTTSHGDWSRTTITRVGPPDYPLARGTSNPPFDKIKHLMSSRPYGKPEASGKRRGRRRKDDAR